MTKIISSAKTLGRRLRNRLFGYLPNKRGNVAAMVALMFVPILGILGLAGEGSSWLFLQRAEQNAADSAVTAAANGYVACLNGGGSATSCTNYVNEGLAVSKNYGFTGGANTVWSTAARPVKISVCAPAAVTGAACTAACPIVLTSAIQTSSGCFQVTIAQQVPIYMVRLVGFPGNNPSNPATPQMISATAYAGALEQLAPICVLALQTTAGNSITIHGGPKSQLDACTIFSDASETCTGSNNGGAYDGGAVGTDNGCGQDVEVSGAAKPDISAITNLASNIPSHTCSSNPGVTLSGSYTASTLASAIGTSVVSGGDTYLEVCGNLNLSQNVTLSANNNAIIVINNGAVNFENGNFLETGGTAGVDAAGLTLIYQGTSTSPMINTSGSSLLNISAPTSGTWSGVTVYDPVTTSAYSAGNSPAWDLSGIVYMPNSDVQWNGIIGKANSGWNCFDFIVNTLLINGTAQMFNNPLSQCTQAGATVPEAVFSNHYVLVG